MYKNVLLLLIITCPIWGEDYYKVLSVEKTADDKEIKRAFKRLAVLLHPDKNIDDPKAHENFVKLTNAYDILKDPDLRKKYDLYGEVGLNDMNKQSNYHSWNYYQNNLGIYYNDAHVIILGRNDYFENVIESNKIWLVNFYSPMCGHCHYLAPIWKKIALELSGSIMIGAVNCEDNWQLCRQIGIRSYPTLLHYPKNSKQGTVYTGETTYNAIMRFILDGIPDSIISEVNQFTWNSLIYGNKTIRKPTLILFCGIHRTCFTSDDRLKLAIGLDKMVNVMLYFCKEKKCEDEFPENVDAIYLSMRIDSTSCVPVFFKNIENADHLIEKVLEELPEIQELNARDFEDIRKNVRENSTRDGWLVYFYLGYVTEFDITLKKLTNIVTNVTLGKRFFNGIFCLFGGGRMLSPCSVTTFIGKVNCGKYSRLCESLSINRYPIWGVLKPGGAFELNHGRNTMNDIVKFAENSIKASNMWTLSSSEILSILQRNDDSGAWLIDWYVPWCAPCIDFLSELRKASLQFDKSIVRFGTVDCTVHSTICQRYNVRSYPTAMLINGTNTYRFISQKTANNVVNFINETRNPVVIGLDSESFHMYLEGKEKNVMWIIDYFVPWCAPCQQLAAEWLFVAKNLKDLPLVKVATVNCQDERILCKFQGIQSYPTIRLYPFGSEGLSTTVFYNGWRNSISMLRWITKFFPKKIREINPSAFRKEISNGSTIWVIDFFVPWCDHCQKLEPEFAIVAQLIDETVEFGRLNCEIYLSECMKASVKTYPTIMIYKPDFKRTDIGEGSKIESRTSARIQNDILQFIQGYSEERKKDEL